MEQSDEAFFTASEVTALLGIKPATLYAYVSRGVLRSYRLGVGRQRLYRRVDVEALLAVRADTPSPRSAEQPRRIEEARVPYVVTPSEEDRTLRDVDLPDASSWAGDH